MKLRLLLLFLIIQFIFNSCKIENNKPTETKKETEINNINKELTASEIYLKSKEKVALLICYDDNGIPISQGSGFFIANDSLVTNHHVIEGAYRVDIKLIGDENIIKGSKIISASENHDLAVIKTKQEFNYFKIDSLNLESIGSKIFTIGNPRGLEGTISEGIISAKRKEEYDLIQITAPISPGNSGGPLINEKGKVIGVSTFTLTNSQNLNFATPIKYISECTEYEYKPITKKRKEIKDKSAISVTNFKKDGSEFYENISFKNNTSSFIKSITGVLIYTDNKGEVMDYRIIQENLLIPPKLAKRLRIRSFDQDQNWAYYKDNRGYGGYDSFKIEFRLLSYEIDE